MPEIKLYRANGSCSMTPHILLRYLNIPFTSILLRGGKDGYEAADGSFTNAQYRRIHPSGYVPALSVDGEVITENPAVLRYIADLRPELKLLGSGPLDPYRVEEWLVWLPSALHGPGFGALWRPQRFVDDASVFDAVVEKGRKQIVLCYERIEERIVGPHVLGKEWCVVDVYLHTFWRWGKGVGFEMGRFPKFWELARRMEEMESVRSVMVEEGQSLNF